MNSRNTIPRKEIAPRTGRPSPSPASKDDEKDRLAPRKAADLPWSIGQRIKAHRTACNLSQDALARRCEVTRQTVSNWECGRTIPDALSLKRIASACDTTADSLLGEDAPSIIDRSRHARRELLGLFATVIVLQCGTQFARAAHFEALGTSGTAFAGISLGIMIVVAVWIYLIARRYGLAGIRHMVQFASLASSRPGGNVDRLLRFIARWFWTLWLLVFELVTVAGVITSICTGSTPHLDADLAACAVMLGPLAIAFTWERHAPRRA